MLGYKSTSIPSNADLNDYVTVGCYRTTSAAIAATITNTPFSQAYVLWYISPYSGKSDIEKYGKQIAFSGTSPTIKVRQNTNGNWGPWKTISFEDE